MNKVLLILIIFLIAICNVKVMEVNEEKLDYNKSNLQLKFRERFGSYETFLFLELM